MKHFTLLLVITFSGNLYGSDSSLTTTDSSRSVTTISSSLTTLTSSMLTVPSSSPALLSPLRLGLSVTVSRSTPMSSSPAQTSVTCQLQVAHPCPPITCAVTVLGDQGMHIGCSPLCTRPALEHENKTTKKRCCVTTATNFCTKNFAL